MDMYNKICSYLKKIVDEFVYKNVGKFMNGNSLNDELNGCYCWVCGEIVTGIITTSYKQPDNTYKQYRRYVYFNCRCSMNYVSDDESYIKNKNTNK